MLEHPSRRSTSVLLLVLVSQLTIATLLGVLLEGTAGALGRRHRHRAADRAVLRGRRGRAEDVRDPAHRARRARGHPVPLVPHQLPAAALALEPAHRHRQRRAPGQGPEAGPVRHRGGDPHDGRRRGRRGLDRARGATAHPLDLRVRRHRRARGDAARDPTWSRSRPTTHRGGASTRAIDARVLAAPRLRGRHDRRHHRPRLPEGPRAAGARRRRAPGRCASRCDRRCSCPSRSGSPSCCARCRPAVPHGDRDRRVRRHRRARHPRGPARGDRRRDRRRVRRRDARRSSTWPTARCGCRAARRSTT